MKSSSANYLTARLDFNQLIEIREWFAMFNRTQLHLSWVNLKLSYFSALFLNILFSYVG